MKHRARRRQKLIPVCFINRFLRDREHGDEEELGGHWVGMLGVHSSELELMAKWSVYRFAEFCHFLF